MIELTNDIRLKFVRCQWHIEQYDTIISLLFGVPHHVQYSIAFNLIMYTV